MGAHSPHFLCRFAYKLEYQYLDYTCHWYCENHSYDAAVVTEYTHRKQNEKRMQTCRAADDFGIDDVAVYLLDYEEQQHGAEAIAKAAGEETGDKCRNHAEDGAEVWNHIGDACKASEEDCERQTIYGKH